MYGVIEVADVDDPDQHTDHSNCLGQEGAELVQLLLQGCHLFTCLCHCMSAAPTRRATVCVHCAPSSESDYRAPAGGYFFGGEASPLSNHYAAIALKTTPNIQVMPVTAMCNPCHQRCQLGAACLGL